MEISIVGFAVFILIAWGFSAAPLVVNWRAVFWGVALQFLLGLLLFRSVTCRAAAMAVDSGVNALMRAAAGFDLEAGSAKGTAAAPGMASLPDFFLQYLLPMVVLASLFHILYQAGVMNAIVRVFSPLFGRLAGISGVEGTGAGAAFFFGAGAIASVRPFLARMTRSELGLLMTACMATASAGANAACAAAVGSGVPGIAGHLAAASLLAMPAALLAAKLMLPEVQRPETLGLNPEPHAGRSANFMAALLSGAETGGRLLAGMTLLLVAAVGLLGILDLILGGVGFGLNAALGGQKDLSLARFMGLPFRPAAWLMGVPWKEAEGVGELLGVRFTAGGVAAYQRLAAMLAEGGLSARSALVAMYSLCGAAHIPALAMTLGGVAALVPERRDELSVVACRAFLAATLASLMVGCVAGVFFDWPPMRGNW